MVVNFWIGTAISGRSKTTSKKRFPTKLILLLGILSNLSLLGYYKYANFFLTTLSTASGLDFTSLHLVLPLAISFFTFQQIAYLIDSYQGKSREYNFLNYCLFITFFPQLIAGPIVHHKEMMPQFQGLRQKVLDYRNVSTGIFIFSLGLFKKVVIADTFAEWATLGFDELQELSFLGAWTASLSYALQLYFDFSGYTDMAIGSARMFNIRLPLNFNSPYKGLDIQDFWRRWHMTLSRWLRDYLYIPMGGNRNGVGPTYANLFVTFLLGGLWHGAGWTFVAWGAMHGAATMAHKWWHGRGIRMPKWLAWLITFNFVNFAWVFFRAKTFEDAVKVIEGMAGFHGLALPHGMPDKAIGLVVLFLAISVFGKNSLEMSEKFCPNKAYTLFILALLSWSLFSMSTVSEFLYFQF